MESSRSTASDTPLIAPLPSPKRKRNVPPTPPPSSSAKEKMRLETDVKISTVGVDNGLAGSPRTKVACDLQGMQLEDSIVSKLELRPMYCPAIRNRHQAVYEDGIDEDEALSRKRSKVYEIPTTPETRIIKASPKLKERTAVAIAFGSPTAQDPHIPEQPTEVALGEDIDHHIVFKSGSSLGKLKGSGLGRAYPGISQLPDSNSRGRKRAGTPPLATSSASSSPGGGGNRIIDPERAALTWHDDEITGHNTSDPEDDGEGINGIGFKPTPAEAYARAQKRQLQMAEYKSREAREARAKRSQRRKGSDRMEQVEREQQRQVRFLDVEQSSVISIN
ncbi:uncharacterized protein BP5553_09124 [Venustampulla echinocandica]|uniref:Uncharacterized protein n=1 Tax=Venustampulla echinocandica TaxID=2656787 RepID=A0A370TDX5_9HELO|nr:uncharacterized protein BP5553_09124 [Venustampulla echinocandica]RDL32668.1 hypothetical protein BP5553_09124 [Venustampulla echinocandica]